MVQAHRVICPVRDSHVQIDLPADFPEGSEVEVIVLPVAAASATERDRDSAQWLGAVWGCAPDFPDRLPDAPPEPVETFG